MSAPVRAAILAAAVGLVILSLASVAASVAPLALRLAVAASLVGASLAVFAFALFTRPGRPDSTPWKG